MDSSNFLWTIGFCCLALILTKLYKLSHSKKKSTRKPVPTAGYCLPFIGHVWALLLPNFKDFLVSSYHSCGPIFTIRIFSREWIYICSKSGVRDYFKANEDTLSLYALFGIDSAFASPGFPFHKVIQVLRSGFAVSSSRYLEGAGAIGLAQVEDAKPESWKGGREHTHKFKALSRRWVDLATADALLGIQLSEAALQSCMKYESFFHSTVAAGSLGLPKNLVDWATKGRMAKLRNAVVKEIIEEFRSYKSQEGKEDSRLLRTAMDVITSERGSEISDTELEGIICTLMVGGSENTAVLIVNILAQLSLAPTCLARCRAEVEPFVREKDWKGLMKAEYLDAVVTETMRLTMGCFAFQRENVQEYNVGDFIIPPNKTIILAAPLIQVYGNCAQKEYSDPETFNPLRFLGVEDSNLLTFGAGRHYCPAKNFSVHLTKLGTAIFLTYLDMKVIPGTLSWDYAAYSVFAEMHFQSKVTKRRVI